MRVTHIIKVVLVAGAERHLLTLLPALRRFDVEPSVLLLVEPDKPMDDYVAMLQAREIPVVREVIHRHADPSLVGRIRRQLRQRQPDLVHTHLLHADLYGLLAAKSLRLPVITSRHNDNAFRRHPIMRGVNWLWWRFTDEGIAISDAIRDFCIEVENAPPVHIRTIRYGVEPDSLTQDVPTARAALRESLNVPPDALIVGTMSRLIEQKGLSYGLQAFAQVQDQHPNALLVVSGSGVLHEVLEAEAKSLKLRAHFIGWQPDPLQVLAGYDLLLMPSLWEGFGLVLLEAMAQGLPIIASRVSAIPEVVHHNETGLLVAPRDVSALADALNQLLDNSHTRQQFGEAAQQRLQTMFHVDKMAEDTASLYFLILRP
jgi:glycosyltransferase involved in cell wall biosynthesis